MSSLRYLPLLLLCLLAPSALGQSFPVVPTPNNGPDDNILRGIDARTASDVWAVGDWFDPPTQPFQSGRTRTLAMRWDGTAWTIVPTPDPHPGGNGLWGVAAVGPDLAWAVGHQGGNGAKPMVLRWDGSSWSDYPIPPISTGLGGGTGILLAMHDLAPNDIWAVGTGGSPIPGVSFVAVAYHWDGSAWSLTIPPTVTNFRHDLSAVHGSAPDNVWAVGSWGETYGIYRPLVYRFDGQQWHAMPAPFNENPFMPLRAVAVLAPDDVWVTADRIATGSGPVTAHWDGSSWTEHANPGGTGALLAFAPDDVYGFGSTITHWDGTAWALVDEIEERTYPSLGDATALPDGTMWAAGRWVFDDGSLNPPLRTLTVRGQRAAPAVAVTAEPVSPPVVIGPGGGSFTYRVTLTNTTAQPQSFQAWTAVTGPVSREPVVGPQAVTLPAGATVTRTLTQRVPPNAPAGTYTYHVRLGSFPSGVTASGSFPFTKSSGAAPREADGGPTWAASGSFNEAAPAVASSVLPEGFALSEAWPNPFRDRAQLTLEVSESQAVRAEVYDALGRRVAVLLDGAAEAGAHALTFDGSALPAGVYVVRVTGEAFTATRRVTLVR